MGGLCVALVAGACSTNQPATVEETFALADGQDAFAGTGSTKLLTRAELTAYTSDRAYVRGLARRGVPMIVNHADPRQHRFAVTRMKIAGKTRENSPELFRLLDALPAQHAALGMVAGQMQAQAVEDGHLKSQHTMRATVKMPTPGIVASGSLASRKDALSYGYVDCSVYDGEGNALGDPSYIEIYGNMLAAVPSCTGDLAYASVQSLEGDSFLTENLSSGAVNQSYLLGGVVSVDALVPTLQPPTIAHPIESTGDGVIDICLERGDGTCDYNDLGMWQLGIPLKGSISIVNATIDPVKIREYQAGNDPDSKIFVTLTSTHGGGCTLPPYAIKDFWNKITFTSTQINWDLSGAATNWPKFDADCALVQDRVDLTMDLNIPYSGNPFGGTLPVEISTLGAASPPAPNYHIATPIRVTNSCLAAGTRIATAGGAAQNIEDIHIGDSVANPFANQLTVADVTVGTERTPMVQIVDDRGRDLLMTEMHPIAVVDRGFVAARYLKIGDRVRTQDGTSQLVAVTRKSYGGQVYNLRVGNVAEARSLGVDQTVMYANGFLVGDVQVQDKYQYMELRDRAANDRLAVRWRTDYLTSQRRPDLHTPQ